MLNRHQYQEFVSSLQAGYAPQYAGVPYRAFDTETPDSGEIVEDSLRPAEDVVVLDPCRITGTPVDEWLLSKAKGGTFRLPPKCVRKFRNAEIVGWRSLVTPRGFYSSASHWINNDWDHVRKSMDDGYVLAMDRLYRPVCDKVEPHKIGGTGFFLTYLEPGNHGSFVFRTLPKLIYFLELGLHIDYVIAPDRSAALREVLDHFGFAEVPIFTCKETIGAAFQTLYVADDFEAEGILGSDTLNAFRKMATSGTTERRPAGARKKLFVSRRLNTGYRPAYRPLLNEAALEKRLLTLGFDTIFPETLGFMAQVRQFFEADTIVGASGSGMLNAAFAPPGARVVDIESFHYTVGQHAKIYGSSGKDYAFTFGQFASSEGAEIVREWTVNPQDVIDALGR